MILIVVFKQKIINYYYANLINYIPVRICLLIPLQELLPNIEE